MPTDATGTPTSLGIRKYNTSVDAPSGLGFNGAMDDIDALLANRAIKPASIVSGEWPIWNGSTWVRSSTLFPRITTSTMAGGPPGSPNDGDIWVATAVDGNGTRWSFQYNAGSASGAKWEFIGGSPLFAFVDTFETTASGSMVDLATVGPSVTLTRAGDYTAIINCRASNNTGGQGNVLGVKVGAGAVGDLSIMNSPSANAEEPLIGQHVFTAAASDVVKLQYRTGGGGTGSFGVRRLTVLPKRIA